MLEQVQCIFVDEIGYCLYEKNYLKFYDFMICFYDLSLY
jgi:hypothetical protein